MPRLFEHVRLSPEEFSELLTACGLEPVKFRRLTGASPNAVRSWLLPEDRKGASEPPFWVTSWLEMYRASQGARDVAENVAAECIEKSHMGGA